MSSNMFTILDANIIIIPEEPLTHAIKSMSLFEEKDFAPLIGSPLKVEQSLSFDATLGVATGMYLFEGMQSHKTIHLSSTRIEVHDRSGDPNIEATQIPETMMALANILHINRIKAIGTNWEITFKSPQSVAASTVIAEKLLWQDTSFLPANMKPTGGSADLFIVDDLGTQYILKIESRGQGQAADEFWMLCNANNNKPEPLSIELLKEMFQQSYRLLFEVKESLFPVSYTFSLKEETDESILPWTSLPAIQEEVETEEERDEREWDELISQPHVQKGLSRFAEKIRRKVAMGEYEEGGFAIE
jgi:hypothetical protein